MTRTLASSCLALALCAVPLCSAAQSANISIPIPETLEFQLRMSIAPGTQQLYCYQEKQLVLVGAIGAPAGAIATVPVSLPDPVIRCLACNSWGCSPLSSNAAVIVGADPLDLDGSGEIDVRDMAMCVVGVQQEIY